ncbi:hypothetical protein JOS77_18845 [Chromobacterium haemolyticum]|nr:hypothetical protein JOS77_18845 [Chromobacterium haemolyticum]
MPQQHAETRGIASEDGLRVQRAQLQTGQLPVSQQHRHQQQAGHPER